MPEADATTGALADDVLARRIAAGPPAATVDEEAELYRRYAPRVRLYGRRHLRDEAAAEDLAQEVLLLVFDKLRAGDVRSPGEIGSYILGVSRRLAAGERRRRQRREDLAARYLAPSPVAAHPTEATLDAPRLASCLRALDARDRLVVLLTWYAEQDAPRIAADLGLSAGAVRVIRHRAMARLRDCVLGGAQA
ncbi:hypothetical protein TBR22_A13180 [Luteitalea sp. TBR-22]|uniref:RNA polymerase sigma factor n=1 Tax=Luteitalea sp. TBR-22 TaxID=2802971 RepID=UPI001AFACC05|nr:sigma-70 family RNA polymerase sigma factor [Luteitalea sp. TBR-22]BCS32109.1 hypothetical protein TBR22_A13180 [Luteitalea sp. TBR-22]